jgi:glycogen(starch) synthase
LKLLIVNNVFPPGFVGGYELAAFELALELKARGHELLALTSDYFVDEAGEIPFPVDRGLACTIVSHERVPPSIADIKGPYYNYSNIRKLGSALRKFEPDVVMLFNLQGLGALGILQFVAKIGVPTVLYIMDNVFEGVIRNSHPYQAHVATFGVFRPGKELQTIAMSRNVIREISETTGMSLGDVTYVPGWSHISLTAADPTPDDARNVRFVFASRITPHKGIDLILEASDQLVRSGTRDFSVDVYGQGHVAQLLQRIRGRELDAFIRYTGSPSKPDLMKLLAGYDALLFPTWKREPFGFIVSEAASAGCIPIMTAGIGASEWFINDVDCIKIPRRAEALCTAMRCVIMMSGPERMQMRRTAIRSARQYLSFDRCARVVENVCIQVRDSCSERADRVTIRAIEAAFLCLGHMWEERLT